MNKPLSILLVEDESPKSNHICRIITEQLGPKTEIHTARSVASALTMLEDFLPDLLLLDMSLPTYDLNENESGGDPQPFGGREILWQLTYSDISVPTIIITGYEAFPGEDGMPITLQQIQSELQIEFPKIIKDVLHYSLAVEYWEKTLVSYIEQIINNREIVV